MIGEVVVALHGRGYLLREVYSKTNVCLYTGAAVLAADKEAAKRAVLVQGTCSAIKVQQTGASPR